MSFASQHAQTHPADQVASPTQRVAFAARLSAFVKKIGVLRSVVSDAHESFPGSGYDKIQDSVTAAVAPHGTTTGWRGWARHLIDAFRSDHATMYVAGEKLRIAESDAQRLGFQIGARLEREPDRSIADRLLKRLADVGLYRPGKSAQIDLLQGDQYIRIESVSDIADRVQFASAAIATSRAGHIVSEAVRLTKMLDEVIFVHPERREGHRELSSGDGQMAFFLRDSLKGLVQEFGKLRAEKKVPAELQETLDAHSETLRRAAEYAAWNQDLEIVLGHRATA